MKRSRDNKEINEKQKKNKNGDISHDSFSSELLLSCGRLDGETENSVILGKIKGIGIERKILKPMKKTVASQKEASLTTELLSRLGNKLMRASVSSYGIFLFIFGIVAFLCESAKPLLLRQSIWSIDVTSALVAVFTIIMSFFLIIGGSKRSFAQSMLESKIMSYTLFELFGVRKESFETRTEYESMTAEAALFGVLAGLFTLVTTPGAILLKILLLCVGVLVMAVPESGVVMTFMLIPFVDLKVLFWFTAFVWLAYIFKALIGKRSFKPNFTEGCVFLFALITVLGGMISYTNTGVGVAFLRVWFILLFILVSSLIRDKAWILRCFSGVIMSAGAYSIFALAKMVLDYVSTDLFKLEFLNSVLRSVGSRFELGISTGLYMCVAVILYFSVIGRFDGVRPKFWSTVTLILSIVCIVMTFSPIVWLAFILGFVSYLASHNKKILIVLPVTVAVLIAGYFLLPDSVMGTVSDFTGISIEGIRSDIDGMLSYTNHAVNNSLVGLGIEDISSMTEISRNTGTDAGILIHVLAETGLASMLLLIFIMMLVFGAFGIWGYSARADRLLKERGKAVSGAVFGIVLSGLLYNFFADTVSLAIFWMMLGYLYAISNVLKSGQNSEEEEKINIYRFDPEKDIVGTSLYGTPKGFQNTTDISSGDIADIQE